VAASIIERARPGATTTREPIAAEILPVRCRIEDGRCRACGRCVDVCPFHALRIVDEKIRLDAAVCRGCGLCTAVCPTATLQWSGGPLAGRTGDDKELVFACQRRTGSVADANVVRLRCVGQLDAGLLLDFADHKIRIAGCAPDRCRFTTGATHAAEQIERARAIAKALGLDESNIVADWSPDRLHDPLEFGVRQPELPLSDATAPAVANESGGLRHRTPKGGDA
jgi:ferredoxin